jgi:hypothetical protein
MAGIQKTNTGLVAYAKAQLGLPYWYGTFGQVGSESLFKSKAKQYAATGYYTRWTDYQKQYGLRVHDCVGLIKGYIWSDTAVSVPKYKATQDKSAVGMYTASVIKGTISSFPKHIGQLVYKSSVKTNAKRIHHVGVYIGNDCVIEAKGHEEGVVQTKFSTGNWTHWSQCPYIIDDTVSDKQSYAKDYDSTFVITGRSVYIRAEAGTVAKSLGVLSKGALVICNGFFIRVQSRNWLCVTATLKSGKVIKGWVSEKYLKKI